MPVKKYGVWKGRPIHWRIGQGANPHYQIHMVDQRTHFRIAVNVKSKLAPSELLYLINERFEHPVLSELRELPQAFTPLESRPGGVALDYIRGNLFDRRKMLPLPHNLPGPDNDLNEKLNFQVQRALADETALLYAFGARWGPEEGNADRYFGFEPGNGIHDIHMNQGNSGQFVGDDGVWQDGGLLLHFPEQNQWVGIFLAFQSQAWHTDDETGHAISTDTADGLVRIIAAMVNPQGADPGHERVLVLNTSPQEVNLAGWAIGDKNKRKQVLDGPRLAAGSVTTVVLDGRGAQLSNRGGIISLLDDKGTKIHGVSYSKAQAARQGWTLTFQD